VQGFLEAGGKIVFLASIPNRRSVLRWTDTRRDRGGHIFSEERPRASSGLSSVTSKNPNDPLHLGHKKTQMGESEVSLVWSHRAASLSE
jgi:hypothetical protein